MTGLRARPLEETTWPDFARLVESHKGVWGGCWCMSFHAEGLGRSKTVAQNRSEKQARVREGRAHAALVYDGPDCVGWCQFGPTDELPRIKHRRAYLNGFDALRTGGSLVSSSAASIGGTGSPTPRSTVPCARSRGSAAEPWRVIPKTSQAGRCPRRFCTTARCRCSSAMGSSGSVSSASITGWSPRSCAARQANGPHS
jgi:hypothetical protein